MRTGYNDIKFDSKAIYIYAMLTLWAVLVAFAGTTAQAQTENDTFVPIDAGLTGVISSSSAWGDYDGDGDLDLVINGYDLSSNEAITTIYDNEEGSFTDSGAEILGLNLGDVDWGDFDGDGNPDLVVIGDDGSDTEHAAIYQNDGDGTFSDIEAGLLGVDVGSANWGDYDNDGDLDLVITGSDSAHNQTAIIYENDDGTFTDAEAGLTGVDDSCSDWGDFDNDGDLDLVIAGAESPFDAIATIYENDGGSFTDIEAGITGVEECSCKWGDFDGDGDLDLIVAGVDNNDDKTATIYRNDEGNFTAIDAGLVGVEEPSSAWGDFDADGDLDLVITGEDTSNNASATVYRNDEGSFSAIDAGLTGVENGSSNWGDFDNDGYPDLVITGERTATIYRNQSAPSTSTENPNFVPSEFALQQNYPNPFNPSTVISYQLPENSFVRLEVFDLLGRKVATLVDGERKSTGTHSVSFDAESLSSGMYIYRMQAGGEVFTKKLTLIK